MTPWRRATIVGGIWLWTLAAQAQIVVEPFARYRAIYELEDPIPAAGNPSLAGDDSPYANTLSGNAQMQQPGHTGFSAHFNGAQNLATANSPALTVSEAMTVELWVKPSFAANASGYLIESFTNNRLSWQLGYTTGANAGQLASVALSATGSGGVCTVTYKALKFDTWQHVSAAYDGVTGEIRVNGVDVATQSCPFGPLQKIPPPVGLCLPPNNGVGLPGSELVVGGGYSGNIDELRLAWGRGAPSNCPQGMVDTYAGYCIDATAQGPETKYGDSLASCATRLSEVCTFSQIYTAEVNSYIAISPVNGAYRTSDIMFRSSDALHYFGGASVRNAPPNLLQWPNSVIPLPGPDNAALPYFCCRNR